MQDKLVVGRAELVSLPEFGFEGVAARIDTGAATSSIHCAQVEEVVDEHGQKVIRFHLLDEDHPEWTGAPIQTAHYRRRRVRSSFGDEQQRFVITTTVVMQGRPVETQLMLADRENMRYPLLIGRRLLAGNFVVDVQSSGVTGDES